MPELVLKLGDNILQNYVFDKDVMSIGRSRDNDIVVENLSVSRNHARIRRQNGKYILTDLNSANGTYVNGVRVSKTEIVDDDIVTIGKHKLCFNDKPVDDDQLLGEAHGADRTVIVDRTPVPVLCISEGKLKGQEFPLTKFETAIGKAPSNDIVLGDDWFLAKKQAVLVRRGNAEYELHDMGGFRKSKVNGEQVEAPRLLQPGDVIEFGNTRCVFQLSSDMPEAMGRVPQEMSLEDSIFPSGSSYPEIPISEEGFQRETPFVHEIEEPAEPIGESAFSGFDAAGLVRDALGNGESPGQRSEADISAVFGMNPDTSEPEILLRDTGGLGEYGDAARVSSPINEAKTASPDVAFADEAAQPAEALELPPANDEAALVIEEEAEPNPVQPEAPAEELEPAMAMAATEPQEAPSATGGRSNRKKRREQQRQKGLTGSSSSASAAASNKGNVEIPAPDHQPQVEVAQNQAAAVPGQTSEPEIALWEAALQNHSPVIRRQAARMLKKLTGRDYEV